ncbi:MAG: hypothetical protein ACR2PA_20505 [Hyphomicrobiaceae bacterium]
MSFGVVILCCDRPYCSICALVLDIVPKRRQTGSGGCCEFRLARRATICYQPRSEMVSIPR